MAKAGKRKGEEWEERGKGLGTRRHGQEGALALPPTLDMLYCALVFNELFMHYFHNLSSASKGFAPRSHAWTPLGDLGPQCPPPENIQRAYTEKAGGWGRLGKMRKYKGGIKGGEGR